MIKKHKDLFILKYNDFKLNLNQEKQETKAMVNTFFVLLKSKLPNNKEPSNKDIIDAIEQFKDVNRMAFLLSLVALPGSVVIIPFIKHLAGKFNIDIMPSSFKDSAEIIIETKTDINTKHEEKKQ